MYVQYVKQLTIMNPWKISHNRVSIPFVQSAKNTRALTVPSSFGRGVVNKSHTKPRPFDVKILHEHLIPFRIKRIPIVFEQLDHTVHFADDFMNLRIAQSSAQKSLQGFKHSLSDGMTFLFSFFRNTCIC